MLGIAWCLVCWLDGAWGCLVALPGYCHGIALNATVVSHEVKQSSDVTALDGWVELRYGGSNDLSRVCWAKAVDQDYSNQSHVQYQLMRHHPVKQVTTVALQCLGCRDCSFPDDQGLVPFYSPLAAVLTFVCVVLLLRGLWGANHGVRYCSQDTETPQERRVHGIPAQGKLLGHRGGRACAPRVGPQGEGARTRKESESEQIVSSNRTAAAVAKSNHIK